MQALIPLGDEAVGSQGAPVFYVSGTNAVSA